MGRILGGSNARQRIDDYEVNCVSIIVNEWVLIMTIFISSSNTMFVSEIFYDLICFTRSKQLPHPSHSYLSSMLSSEVGENLKQYGTIQTARLFSHCILAYSFTTKHVSVISSTFSFRKVCQCHMIEFCNCPQMKPID